MRDDDPLAPPEEDPEREREQRDSSERSSEGSSEKSESEEKKSGGATLHEGEFTAPSVGPHTVIEKRPPEERLDFDKISSEDSMGRDKRRQVVGGTYGPTRARVLGTFAAFFAIVGAVAVGLYFLAQELDQPPKENPAVAPWSAEDAPQKPPRELQ